MFQPYKRIIITAYKENLHSQYKPSAYDGRYLLEHGLQKRGGSGQGCHVFITIIFVYSNYFDYLYKLDLPWEFLNKTGKNVARKLQTQSSH